MMFDSLKYYLKKHYNIFQYYSFRVIYFFLKALPIMMDGRYYNFHDRFKYLGVIAS